MRVAIVCPGRFHLFDLSRELLKWGHHVTVYTSLPQFYARQFIGPNDRLKVRGFWWHEIVWRLERLVRGKLGYGQLFQFHFHWLFSWNVRLAFRTDVDFCFIASQFALPLIPLLAEKNVKVIIERGSPHAHTQLDLIGWANRLYGASSERPNKRVVEQELVEYERAWRISVPSNFCRSSFLERGFEKSRVVKIPYGVSLDTFYPKKCPLDDTCDPCLIAVGNKTAGKGSQELVLAVSQLIAEGLKVQLLMVGPEASDFTRFISKFGPMHWLENHPPVPQQSLVHFYHRANIFIMPSFSEGLAMVTLQAMACGLPVIATNNSGASDHISHGFDGYIYDAGKPDQLISTIKEALQPNNYSSIRKHSMAKALNGIDGLSWADYGREVHYTLCQ